MKSLKGPITVRTRLRRFTKLHIRYNCILVDADETLENLQMEANRLQENLKRKLQFVVVLGDLCKSYLEEKIVRIYALL